MKSLNYFVLYCKGWLKPTSPNISESEFIKKLLTLDSYMDNLSDDDMMCIILSNFSLYNDSLTKANANHLDMYKLYRDLKEKSSIYKTTDLNKILLKEVIEFVRYSTIVPKAPHFSKKLYQYGVKFANAKEGQTYTTQNKIVSKFFNSI